MLVLFFRTFCGWWPFVGYVNAFFHALWWWVVRHMFVLFFCLFWPFCPWVLFLYPFWSFCLWIVVFVWLPFRFKGVPLPWTVLSPFAHYINKLIFLYLVLIPLMISLSSDFSLLDCQLTFHELLLCLEVGCWFLRLLIYYSVTPFQLVQPMVDMSRMGPSILLWSMMYCILSETLSLTHSLTCVMTSTCYGLLPTSVCIWFFPWLMCLPAIFSFSLAAYNLSILCSLAILILLVMFFVPWLFPVASDP